MNDNDRENALEQLHRKLLEQRENRISVAPMHQVERNELLREVRRTAHSPHRRFSPRSWISTVRGRLALSGTGIALVVLLVVFATTNQPSARRGLEANLRSFETLEIAMTEKGEERSQLLAASRLLEPAETYGPKGESITGDVSDFFLSPVAAAAVAEGSPALRSAPLPSVNASERGADQIRVFKQCAPAVVFIGMFVLAGMIVATIATMVQ